jgi:two-component system, NtrC family, response regulator AtoC
MTHLRRIIQNRVMTPYLTSSIELLAEQREDISEEVGEDLSFVAASSAMRKVHAQAELFARVDVPILIVGESGSGKEIVARLIHKRSNRSANKFLKLSCAAVDPEILESELFEKKNGVSSDDNGSWNSPIASGKEGTLLLDEVDEMPLRAQAKLVCLLQDSQFFSGRENTARADVRVIAATKCNIRTALSEKKLRKDLYYYLSAFTISVPPLRQRKDEIPLLLRHFTNRAAAGYGLPVPQFSPEVILACQNYSWPGNLRELEKFAKRYVVSGGDDTMWGEDHVHHPPKQGEFEAAGVDDGLESLPDTLASKSLLYNVKEEAERNAITIALEQTRWNRTAAARLLNISYRTLLYKIQQYRMVPRKY